MEAPRWRLTNPHYLRIRELPDGTRVEWEHSETARTSGRAVRKLFAVPMFLDPKDPADHNYPGEIIVAHEADHNAPMDYIFEGQPTNEMEPLNEAAQALTDEMRIRWEHPIDTLPVNGGMTSYEQEFMKNMMEAFAKQLGQQGMTAPASVPREQYDELKARLEKLEALIVAQNNPPAPVAPAAAPAGVARRA